jgi:Cu2+-exporting ATPase
LVKSPTALERLRQVDMVVFDKTGTLTVGRPELIAGPGIDQDAVKQAAALARFSRHPLAQALVRATATTTSDIANVEEHRGQGLSCVTPEGVMRLGSRSFIGLDDDAAVGPELWLARPGQAPVQFHFADQIRIDAHAVVAALKGQGKHVAIVSGDRRATVGALADMVGIDDWYAEIDPAGKAKLLADWAKQGRRILMVGDGMNDAPALAAAHVSASPSTALDIAQSAADIVFQGDGLQPVLDILDMGRRAARIMRQNLAAALLYNLGAVPLAIAGYVTPLIAALSMSSSSVVVIVNALRLNFAAARQRR